MQCTVFATRIPSLAFNYADHLRRRAERNSLSIRQGS